MSVKDKLLIQLRVLLENGQWDEVHETLHVLNDYQLESEPPSWACDWGDCPGGRWSAFRIGEVEQRFRWLKAGAFVMGSPETEVGRWDRENHHPVILTAGFWLADTPCTQALWKAITNKNPSWFKGDDERPVENVSFSDVQAAIEQLNRDIPGLKTRLPTEAEWEYGCRAGVQDVRYGPLADIAWYSANSDAQTHPVKQKEPNAWRLYDMLGNVWEWCQDWFDVDEGRVVRDYAIDPTGPTHGVTRVARGGGWNRPQGLVRAAYRTQLRPDIQTRFCGFRFACSA